MSEEDKRSKNKKIIQGRVVSIKMDKTLVVRVETLKLHPLFKKAMRRSKRVKVHDERNETRVGDTITAIETRPLSKEKRYRLFKIMERTT